MIQRIPDSEFSTFVSELKPKSLHTRHIHEIYVIYMVRAMINISEDTNQILNIVKARFNLKDKSKAIEKVVLEYGKEILEPELRPEFIQKINRIEKEGKFKTFKSVDELRNYTENA